MARRVVDVLLPVALDQAYSYRVPDELTLAPGDLVVSTQPEQVPVLEYYLPDGLRFATLTGEVRDTGVTDWRDGPDHADLAEADSIHDRDYLAARLGTGEAFDWFYADADARAAQIRTPITDGAHGKPWVFRAKDLVGWWSNRHWERDGGVETRTTAWVPGAKPIWLTEVALMRFDGGRRVPSGKVQARFVTLMSRALAQRPWVSRWAWFGLPASATGPSSGLYRPGARPTTVGRAYAALP